MKLATVKFASAVTDPSFKGNMEAHASDAVQLELDGHFVRITATKRDKTQRQVLVPLDNVSFMVPLEQPGEAKKPPPAPKREVPEAADDLPPPAPPTSIYERAPTKGKKK